MGLDSGLPCLLVIEWDWTAILFSQQEPDFMLFIFKNFSPTPAVMSDERVTLSLRTPIDR